MYRFIAHYINMDTDAVITRNIEIDGQFFENEHDIYLYAMSRAYSMKNENELFYSIEFICS